MTTKRLLSKFLLSLATLSLSSQAVLAYELPKASHIETEHSKFLEVMSKAVGEVASSSQKALVFISVSKTASGPQMFDPFDFFFGVPQRNAPQPKQEGFGSGFFVDLEKGYIITNNHVVENADTIKLKFSNNKSYTGKLVGADPNTDVAVVQVVEKDFDRKNLKALELADSDKVGVGDFVLALGAPFLLEASVSSGIVSAVGRGNLQLTQIGDFIQTDAAINPGNSGGPLVDVKGQVVGMNTAIYSRSGAYNGIGFAVPANLVRKIANALISTGSVARGYIGISYEPVREEWLASLHLPQGTEGIIVAEVDPKGPAKQAGIEPNDVITGLDGKNVIWKNVSTVIGMKKPGDPLEVTFYREGKMQTVKIKVGTYPEMGKASVQSSSKEEKANTNRFGFAATTLNDALRKQFDTRSSFGIVITHVEPKSPAWETGLEEGDAIVAVNGRKVRSLEEFLAESKDKDLILIHIERKGRFYFVSLKARKP